MLLNFKLLGQVSTLRNDQLSQPIAVPKSHCQFVKLVGQWGMNCLSESEFCYPCTWGAVLLCEGQDVFVVRNWRGVWVGQTLKNSKQKSGLNKTQTSKVSRTGISNTKVLPLD